MTLLEKTKQRLSRRISDLIWEADEKELFELMTELGSNWPGDLYESLEHMKYIHCCNECQQLFGACNKKGQTEVYQTCVERFAREKELVWEGTDLLGHERWG